MRSSSTVLARILSHVVVLLTLLTLAGCASDAGSPTAMHGIHDRMVIPQCLEAIAPQATEWAGGGGLAGNTPVLLGFTPYVFSDIPAEATWSMDVGFGPAWKDGPAPLFHGAYGRLVPRPYNAEAMENIIALDETPNRLEPLTNMFDNGQELQFTGQSPVTVNGRSAALFHFASPTGSSHPVEGIGLLWQLESLSVRITVVSSGEYQMRPHGQPESFDWIKAWSGASEQALMALATNLIPLPRCDGS